jgi:hypothetical protein
MNPHNLTSSVNKPPDSTDQREGTGEPPLPESFHLLVKCRDEPQQRELYERLTAQGHDCRVLSL